MSDKSIELAYNVLEKTVENARLQRDYASLTARYDDALRRINDLQAENDAMRIELARRT